MARFTTFSAPGAGTEPGPGVRGTYSLSINGAGTVTGYYIDTNGVNHGFVGAPGATQPISILQALRQPCRRVLTMAGRLHDSKAERERKSRRHRSNPGQACSARGSHPVQGFLPRREWLGRGRLAVRSREVCTRFYNHADYDFEQTQTSGRSRERCVHTSVNTAR